jgi:hypothetical protein
VSHVLWNFYVEFDRILIHHALIELVPPHVLDLFGAVDIWKLGFLIRLICDIKHLLIDRFFDNHHLSGGWS